MIYTENDESRRSFSSVFGMKLTGCGIIHVRPTESVSRIDEQYEQSRQEHDLRKFITKVIQVAPKDSYEDLNKLSAGNQLSFMCYYYIYRHLSSN